MKTTISTDTFSNFIENINSKWKNNPQNKIKVSGNAKKDFEKWLALNFPEAIQDEEGYYSISMVN